MSDTPLVRKVAVRRGRRGPIRRDRRKTAALELIADALRVIADKYIGTTGEPAGPKFSDKYFGTTGNPAADSLPFRERFELYTAPVGTYSQITSHVFQEVPGNRFCGECGGGRLHAIHISEVKHNG